MKDPKTNIKKIETKEKKGTQKITIIKTLQILVMMIMKKKKKSKSHNIKHT